MMFPVNCMRCGAVMIGKRTTGKDPYHYTFSGLPNVYLRWITVYRCPECADAQPSIPRMPELHRVIAQALARKPGRLKGSEIRFLRKNLGIPAKKIARVLGLAPETYSRVENEKNPGLSGAAEKLFRLMASDAPGKGGVREAILGLAENMEREDRRTARARAVSTFRMVPRKGWKADAA